MRLYLFDDKPAQEGEKHGDQGPCHAATVSCDYEYQAEMWLSDIGNDHPSIVRVTSDTGRTWIRNGCRFVELKGGK